MCVGIRDKINYSKVVRPTSKCFLTYHYTNMQAGRCISPMRCYTTSFSELNIKKTGRQSVSRTLADTERVCFPTAHRMGKNYKHGSQFFPSLNVSGIFLFVCGLLVCFRDPQLNFFTFFWGGGGGGGGLGGRVRFVPILGGGRWLIGAGAWLSFPSVARRDYASQSQVTPQHF